MPARRDNGNKRLHRDQESQRRIQAEAGEQPRDGAKRWTDVEDHELAVPQGATAQCATRPPTVLELLPEVDRGHPCRYGRCRLERGDAVVRLRYLVCSLSLTAGLLVSPVLAPSAEAGQPGALLSVVHGVRGLVADIRIDGVMVIRGFTPERVTDPLPLSAGRHHLQVWRSGVAPRTKPVLDTSVTVKPGEQDTAALGISTEEHPTLTLYRDSNLLPTPGSTALAVRGLADVPSVKVLVGDRTLAASLRPGGQDLLQVAAGTYPVSAETVAGVMLPPQNVPVAAGRAVVLYLIGSRTDGTLGWVAQVIRPVDSAAAPTRINTGVGPLPSTPTRVPLGMLLSPLALGAALLPRSRRYRAA